MKEQNRIKVSIIVPVYNGPEAALRKCIESIMAQTMQGIQIILVDDGSNDNSGSICDEYAKNDNRIEVIHKNNEGLAAARNSGYRAARGEWITFLDSDDWLESDMCRETYLQGEEHNADVVIFGTVQEFGQYKNLFKYHYNDGTEFEGEACKQLQCEILNFTGNIATAWAKLIKKCVLDEHHIEHNEMLRQGSEGIEFNIRLFEKIKRVYFTDKVYYHYIYNPNSISAKHDEKNHYFVIRCFEEIQRNITLSSNRSTLETVFYNRFAYVIVAAAISGYFSPSNKESYKAQKQGYLNYLKEPLVKATLEKLDYEKIDLQRVIVLRLIAYHFFLPIKLLSYIRYKQKHRGKK